MDAGFLLRGIYGRKVLCILEYLEQREKWEGPFAPVSVREERKRR